jgi:hypothetical protein
MARFLRVVPIPLKDLQAWIILRVPCYGGIRKPWALAG